MSALQVQLPLGRRFAPTPAPVSAVPAPAPGPTAASQEAVISMAAPAPEAAPAAQAAPALGSVVPTRAPAPAPAVARQGLLMQMPAPALAPAAASKEALINITAATPEAEPTTRELYDTQVHTWITLALQRVSLPVLLVFCIARIEHSAYTSSSPAKSSSVSGDAFCRYRWNALAPQDNLKP